jgi:protein kinase C substrate 80K-H
MHLLILALYLGLVASDAALFTCADGTVIDIMHVNDDYCDCEHDGDDEPLTSACSHTAGAVFACGDGSIIFSALVQDGVCDCCDGADEQQLSCPNVCAQQAALLEQRLKEQRNRFQQGYALRLKNSRKHTRLLASSVLPKNKGLLRNWKGATADYNWDHLRGRCLKFPAENSWLSYFTSQSRRLPYRYTLCPFGKSVQREQSSGRVTRLGNWHGWECIQGNFQEKEEEEEEEEEEEVCSATNGVMHEKQGVYGVMRFAGGDSSQCDGGYQQREVAVTVGCGRIDRLIAVEEPDPCEYTMTLETAAACAPGVLGAAGIDELTLAGHGREAVLDHVARAFMDDCHG